MNLYKFLRMCALVWVSSMVIAFIAGKTDAEALAQAGPVPQLASKLLAGSRSVMLLPASTDTAFTDSFSIYEFDSGVSLAAGCGSAAVSEGTLQSLVISTTSTATSFAPPSTPPPPYTFTLTLPLVAGSTLCISETAAGAATVWSAPLFVTDPNDYGRVRTYFVAGVQVSNQQSASASSTAGQYVEAGFDATWLRAKDRKDLNSHSRTPGISTNIDVRLSPIPVAAPATNTTTTATSGTSTPAATISTTPNLLSSQQSARIVTSLYFPWKATHWNNRSDYFTIAPLVRGGFATLLNPSISSPAPTTTTTATTTATTTTTVTGQFNSAYSFFAYGARIGWDRYSANTNEAPQTITQFLLTLGNYSNLPSYICKAATAGVTVALNPNSACGVVNTPLAIDPVMSRMLIPRLDVEGLAKLPNYPFVIGMDANLAQYTVYRHRGIRRVDYMNKAGNDIRIYVGFSIPLDSLVSKLGITSP